MDKVEGSEIEIEFDSELGRVLVLREGEMWRCAVQLAGQGPEGEGTLGSDGERGAAYQCYEYLSHLLKHDNLFTGMVSDDLTKKGDLARKETANRGKERGESPGKESDAGRKKRGR
jgi:hypothetical protein